MFFPLLAITSLTTIIGFLTTGMAMEEGAEQIDDSSDGGFVSNIKGLAASVFSVTSQWLSLSVGILGAISTFLTSMGKHTNYQSKKDMHEMAEGALEKVVQGIAFEVIDDEARMQGHIDKQKAIFMSVEASCTAEVPPKILQAFVELDSAMKTKDFLFRKDHYKRFYNMLWKKFTKKQCCMMNMPFNIPEIDLPNSDIGILIEEEYAKYKRDKQLLEGSQTEPISSTMSSPESRQLISPNRSDTGSFLNGNMDMDVSMGTKLNNGIIMNQSATSCTDDAGYSTADEV